MKLLPVLAVASIVAAARAESSSAQSLPPQGPPSQNPSVVLSSGTQDGAMSVLMQQGQRWLDLGRPELAMASVARALAADANNREALLLAARIEAERNNRDAAASYVARLRTAGATANQVANGESLVRGASVDRAGLDQARRLAQEGRLDEAATQYRAAFGPGDPPAAYAREYYQVLSGIPSGREAGQRGLSILAAQPGASDRTQLALAESLTYVGTTRADGIRRLADLAAKPDVAEDAKRMWKQALGFYGNDPAVVPMLADYLKRYPDDADAQRRLNAAKVALATQASAVPQPGDDLRKRGFAELDAGALPASAQRFDAALALNPKDPDALGGLGIVRLRQNRAHEARDLLERAIAADPAHAAQWQRALDGAAYTEELPQARSLLQQGNFDGADTVLQRAIKREVQDNTDAEVLLGELAQKRRNYADAEQHFRTALAKRPNFMPATAGLNRALVSQGRRPESAVPSPPSTGGQPVNAQAERLRVEAMQATAPESQVMLLRLALAGAPSSSWIRLDLARALQRAGQSAEARSLVEEFAGQFPSPDSNYAAALLAEETGRPREADAFLSRIPSAHRSPDMARLQARMRTAEEIRDAAAELPTAPAEAKQRLMTLAARPDPTGGGAAAAIQALAAAGEPTAATAVARTAFTTNTTGAARLAIAGALLSGGLNAQAAATAAQLDDSTLSPAERQDLAVLRTGIAVRVSDELNEAGNQQAAFERLRPALAGGGPQGQLALARLYQGAKQPGEAARIANAVLERDPRNMGARRGAIDAAIANNDQPLAERLATDGRALFPNDSRATFLQAHVARAFGDLRRAKSLLELAALERREELGSRQSVAAPSIAIVNPFGGGGTATMMGSAATSPDALSRDISSELALVRYDTAPLGAASGTVRSRSGTAGLDQLQEFSAIAEASFSPAAAGGRFIARVMPVFLDAGTLGTTAGALRYGTNAASGTTLTSAATTAQGVALGASYQRGDSFKVEGSSSPLGFPVTNVLGSVEAAPRISDTVRLRLRAERQSVLDSLLSYAGARDPVTGQTWGGVTQNRGHAQFEIPLGEGGAYAGGGYSVLTGEHVARNTKVEGGAGFTYPVYRNGTGVLTSGIDLVYFSFANNQRGFTLGQGGYFSPQNFVAFNVPVDYRDHWGKLQYRVGAIVGYANFRENGSALFPVDASLQNQAEEAALTNVNIPTHNQAQTHTGFIGGLRVDLNYPLSDTLSVAGNLRVDKAANWNESRLTIRLENRF